MVYKADALELLLCHPSSDGIKPKHRQQYGAAKEISTQGVGHGSLDGLCQHSNALCQRVPHLLPGADIYRADNIQRKQPQLHRQVRHSLQLLPQGAKRIITPRMIFTIIFC